MIIQTITLEHYLPAIRNRRRANTVYGYENSLSLHVLPRWGKHEIQDIDRDELQEWVDELAKTSGPGGAKKAYKCLRQVIRWAIRKFALYVPDPTVGIEMPRQPLYKPEVLTPRRLKRLIRGFVGHAREATLIISAALWTRPGENYYLRWEDINWRTGFVPIRGTLQEVCGRLYEYQTKTAKSERDLYLPKWALDRLHQIWVTLGRPRGRIIGDAKPSKVAREIKAHIKQAKLPKITMKNLRHTGGTICASHGVPIQDMSGILGHSDINITFRYYYSLTAATVKRAMRKVARSLLGKTCDDMYKGIEIPMPPSLPAAA